MEVIKNKPCLEHLITAINKAFMLEEIIIATSKEKENDSIELWAKDFGITCIRGDEQNVASRFFDIIKDDNCDYFLRISGDSPLFDGADLEKARTQLSEHVDLYTTVGSGRPKGLNFEFVRSNLFRIFYKKFSEAAHFEHVTKYFYEHNGGFVIEKVPFIETKVTNGCKFAFDTTEDYEMISAIFNRMNRPHHEYSLLEKCQMYKEIEHELKRI